MQKSMRIIYLTSLPTAQIEHIRTKNDDRGGTIADFLILSAAQLNHALGSRV
jgi:hypothetical protein